MEYITSLLKEKKVGSLPVAEFYLYFQTLLIFFVSMIVIIST